MTNKPCPKCGSLHTIKNGFSHNGKPKSQCKECGRQFVLNPSQKTVKESIIVQPEQPTNGLTPTQLSKKLKIPLNMILDWGRETGHTSKKIKNKDIPPYHYDKKQKRWFSD